MRPGGTAKRWRQNCRGQGGRTIAVPGTIPNQVRTYRDAITSVPSFRRRGWVSVPTPSFGISALSWSM